jgi:hypothetical protein
MTVFVRPIFEQLVSFMCMLEGSCSACQVAMEDDVPAKSVGLFVCGAGGLVHVGLRLCKWTCKITIHKKTVCLGVSAMNKSIPLVSKSIK